MPGEAGPLHGVRVLVVEDEVLLAADLEMLLEDRGCAIVGPAHKLDDGLRLAREAAIDCAVLDLNLSEGRSDAIADALAGRGVPLLFLTGHTRVQLPERHRAAPLLSKPFREAELFSRLQELLTA